MSPNDFLLTVLMATVSLWQITAWYYTRALIVAATLVLVMAADTYIREGRR